LVLEVLLLQTALTLFLALLLPLPVALVVILSFPLEIVGIVVGLAEEVDRIQRQLILRVVLVIHHL
jgi:hypothetical protein